MMTLTILGGVLTALALLVWVVGMARDWPTTHFWVIYLITGSWLMGGGLMVVGLASIT